ncbi:Prophage CP4-57 regulatory protein (AlpA) [compost metagenome]
MAATNHELPKQNPSPSRRILRLPAVKNATGLGRTKIYELMKEGRFPKARRIAGAQAVGWDSLEIDAWITEQLGEVA